MRQLSLIASLIILGLFSTNIWAEEAKSEEKSEKEDGLHELMEEIGDQYKNVYKIVKKKDASKKADALKAVAALKKAAASSKDHLPHMIEDMKDADKKKKMTESYKKELDVMIASLDKLKKAIDADKWDDALAVIKTMKKHKASSHEKFQDDDHDHDH